MSNGQTNASADQPDVARLGQWLNSWVQPNGAIHGFHNHPIWGSNPYRTLDFTCGHTTFASPLSMALLDLLRRFSDDRARELLQRLVRFQTDAVSDDGQYKHIGFQIGEKCAVGLIHNAVPNVALAYVALHGRELLLPGQLEEIGKRVRASLETLDRLYPNQQPGSGVCNQEYTRTWARMLYGKAFADARSLKRALVELHQFINDFHRRGWPDVECAGTVRSCDDPRQTFEPAEYYGLMIEPLLLGYQIYGEQIFLDEAIALARHVVRSAWADSAGQTRLHRHWIKLGSKYHKIDQPMCIAGSGITARGLASLLRVRPDAEIDLFLQAITRTYAHYQHRGGFFLSATGWQSELDIAPSTAWHAHDFLFLAQQVHPDKAFWDSLFSTNNRTSVLLGHQCIYLERGPHWAIADYLTLGTFRLLGRKDHDRFYSEPFDWMPSETPLPHGIRFPNLPQFWKTDIAILLADGNPADMDVVSFSGLPFLDNA